MSNSAPSLQSAGPRARCSGVHSFATAAHSAGAHTTSRTSMSLSVANRRARAIVRSYVRDFSRRGLLCARRHALPPGLRNALLALFLPVDAPRPLRSPVDASSSFEARASLVRLLVSLLPPLSRVARSSRGGAPTARAGIARPTPSRVADACRARTARRRARHRVHRSWTPRTTRACPSRARV